MADRYVVPTEDGWQVQKKGAQRASAKAATQAEAVDRATEIVSKDGGGKVVVHGTDGKVRDTHNVASGEDNTTAEAAKATTKANAEGARAKAESASDKASSSAKKVGADAKATAQKDADRVQASGKKAAAQAEAGAAGVADQAKKAADGDKSVSAAAKDAATVAQVTGDQVATTTSRAGERVAKDATRVAQHAGSEAKVRADEAGEKVAQAGDRADSVSSGIASELDGAGDAAAARVGRASEAAAQQVDRNVRQAADQVRDNAPGYNPVRIVGNAAAIAVKTGFSVAGAVISTGVRCCSSRPARSPGADERPAHDEGPVPLGGRALRACGVPASGGAGGVADPGTATHRTALVLGGAAPDAGLLAGVHRPLEAAPLQGASAAHGLRLGQLGRAGTVGGQGEEEFGVVVAASRELPVHDPAHPISLVVVEAVGRSVRAGAARRRGPLSGACAPGDGPCGTVVRRASVRIRRSCVTVLDGDPRGNDVSGTGALDVLGMTPGSPYRFPRPATCVVAERVPGRVGAPRQPNTMI